MQPGTQLGHYEILSALGKGGMGEVWRARDSKLGREVAIKTLPEEFARDEERLARFEREAKLLASLNHPNIAAIYGLEEEDGTRFLVLELVEGDTLTDRLKHGAIPVEESLKLALQIAEALEAAHEKGVIHRDLKPANIKITPDDKVKVLDFGLAKAFAGDGAEANLSQSPTLSMAATQQGVILGTAAYMSPEQARGQQVDKRADIWAFGVVLFEMLTGRGTFDGGTVSDVLAGVLRAEPGWNGLPLNLHSRIRFLLERRLEKESKDRYGDISDARVDIQKVLADPDGVVVQPVADGVSETPRSRLSVAIVMSVVTAIVVGFAVWYARPEPPAGDPSHFVISGSPSVPSVVLGLAYTHLAISPDGRHIAYNADLEEGPGFYQRPVDLLEGTALTIGERMDNPFFSPDGLQLGFGVISDRSLKRISIYGGPADTITNLPDGYAFRGASWGPDDDIIFATGAVSGLMRVPAVGGDPEVITKPAEGTQHFWPHILPNGRAVLYTIRSQAVNYQIAMLNLETGEERVLISLGSHPIYAASGHIVYGVETTLHAVPFDADELTVLGDPVPVLEDVSTNGVGATQFGLSSNGSLVYASSNDVGGLGLAWVDRDGTEEPVAIAPRRYTLPRMSPSGEQVLFRLRDQENDIWVWDVGKTLGRHTFAPENDSYPAWTPNGERIAFFSRRTDGVGMYWKAADNTGSVEPILLDDDGGGTYGQPYFFTPDGTKLVFGEVGHPDTGDNIGIVSVEGDSEPEILLNSVFHERNAELSPDGNWMAYQSNESGRPEIYVRPFPNVDDGLWQISNAVGVTPLWSRSGGELFYIEGPGDVRMMTARVETGLPFDHETPQVLFEWQYANAPPGRNYAVSPDGQRFLVVSNRIVDDDGNTMVPSVNIILNWFDELKDKVPVP